MHAALRRAWIKHARHDRGILPYDTFGRRLRAAGVGEETRKVLLGHTNGDITTHYSAIELAELINAVTKIDRSLATPAITLLRVAA